MGWMARLGGGVAVTVLAACGSAIGGRTFEVAAPAVQQIRPYPVVVTDRSGLVTGVDVAMVAVADANGFTREDRASNILGRADQVVVMWPGGGCDDRGHLEVVGDASRLRFTLTRTSAPCAVTVMDRVLLTMAVPIDARRIEVAHIDGALPAAGG